MKLLLVVFFNQLLHFVLLALLVARSTSASHIVHQISLHQRTLFSDLLGVVNCLKLLFLFDLAVDLDGRPKPEHNFEVSNILTEQWGVDREIFINNNHRVHVVLVSQKIQTEDIVFCCP